MPLTDAISIYGVREHGMAAAMNGMALHGGFIPYSGTFLTFTDYCRPSIRLSALMGLRVIYVMTHDSIGSGRRRPDPSAGRAHLLPSLRAMPNLNVFRPADAVETAECLGAGAAEHEYAVRPLALTRQGLPTVRTEHTDENMCARGGYVLAPAEGDRAATILASGSEVEIALAARDALQADGIPTAPSYRCPAGNCSTHRTKPIGRETLGDGVRVAVEAGVTFGWSRYGVPETDVVGMSRASAHPPLHQSCTNISESLRKPSLTA